MPKQIIDVYTAHAMIIIFFPFNRIAYMDFTDSDAFNKALELDGCEFGESYLNVEEAKPRGDSGADTRGERSSGRFGNSSGDRSGSRGGDSSRGERGGQGERGGRGDRGRTRGRGRGGPTRPTMATVGTGMLLSRKRHSPFLTALHPLMLIYINFQ